MAMFSKGQILKMKEAEFQNTVLIPLFRAMKFRDVSPFGGGNLERGKDIIMWKESDLGQRLNYGVVVKSKKITGNAETNNGAMNVLNQVRQMLKTSHINPVNGSSVRIQRCIVACSKEITKEAMNSIEGELENQLDKLVEWLHPETNLFDLIERHLPEQNIFEKLSSVQKNLDESMRTVPYRIVADSDKKFSILPKHEKALEEMPFEIKTNFKFDTNTPEGKEAHKKFNEHFTKGLPIEVDGKFIESFELPDFLPDWMKPHTSEGAKLILEPNRSEQVIPLRMERKLANGETATLDRIDLQVVQQGTEEITLNNDNQKVPYKLTLIISSKQNSLKFDFNYKFRGYNVYQHLQGLKLFLSMFEEGETNIFSLDTGLKIVNADKSIIEPKENFDRFIELFEALVLIQEKVPVLLTIPEPNPMDEDIKNIFEVAEIIKNGKLTGEVPELITDVPLEGAKRSIKIFENEAINYIVVSYSEGWRYNILGKEVNVGTAVLSTNVFISKDNFKEIEKSIEAGNDTIEFCLTPKDEKIIIDFLRWDCADRHTRLHITEPSLV